VRLQVVGPTNLRLLDRTVNVTINDRVGTTEPPFALPLFKETLKIAGPSGRYRFLAAFASGGAAAGGEAEFYVSSPADLPKVDHQVTLWGEDADLAKWLREQGIRVRAFTTNESAARDLILVSSKPPPEGPAAWPDLARRVARGSAVVFLCPEVFKKADNPVGWLPLANKGKLANMASWVYLKDEWAKRHPIFDGLPAGGLLDYTFYRELIPDWVWAGQDAPAEVVAGAINTSLGYGSGLLVSVCELGAGRFVLNTLRIRENLGHDPAAEHLLRNLLNHAAREVGKPVADLPADFDEQLRKLDY
jgi:hypothetical protein